MSLEVMDQIDNEMAEKAAKKAKQEEAAKRRQEKYLADLERLNKKRELLGRTYGDDDCLDPALIKLNGLMAEPAHEKYNNFCTVLRGASDQHLVLDIEAFGKAPDKLHLACIMDMEDTSKFKVYRTWSEIIDDLVTLLVRNKKTRVWAHYGSMYDYTGLCRFLGISRDVPKITSHIIKPSERTGKRGRPTAAIGVQVEWTVAAYGERHEVRISTKIGKSKHTLLLSDSGYHLPAALKTLGAKTRTPAQYTRPVEWIERVHKRIGDQKFFEIVDAQRKAFPDLQWTDEEMFWHACKTRTAEKYCVMDCEILANALQAYRANVRRLSGAYQIDPLDFMTSPQVGLALSITMAPQPRGNDNSLWQYSPKVFRDNPNIKFYRKDIKDIDTEQLMSAGIMDKPVATMDSREQMFSRVGWSVPSSIAAGMVNHLVGGRTEIFATRTAPGMRPMVIDARSMYPSMMASMRFVNPMTVNHVFSKVQGRQKILDYLKDRTGLFRVEIARAENSMLRQFPVIPVKMAGSNEDSRLLWPDWEGKLRCMVSGEELRYFLENSTVENDDVTITGGWQGFLLPQTESPLAQFAARVYGERKKARKAGNDLDASLFKILLNAGGFGPHAEQREQEVTFIMPNYGDSDVRIEDACAEMFGILVSLQEMDPLFDWTAIDKRENTVNWLQRVAIKEIEAWSLQTWRPLQYYFNAEGRQVYSIGIKRFLVSHSIVPWAIQITAAARVTLHYAMAAAAKLGYQVCYTDTDSIHLGIPKDMSDEQFIESMSKVGIEIGDDLGQWGIEHDKIKYCDNALFIAKKTYAYLKGNEVKGFVAKGVSRGNRYLRAAMVTIEETVPKIGSKLGLTGYIRRADAFAGIAKSLPRRHYKDDYSSESLVLRQISEHESATCYSYAGAMSAQHYGNRKALLKAMEDYMSCTYEGVKISSLRAASNRVSKEIEFILSENEGESIQAGLLDKLVRNEVQRCKAIL